MKEIKLVNHRYMEIAMNIVMIGMVNNKYNIFFLNGTQSLYINYLLLFFYMAINGGVSRHLAMSIGFEHAQYPDAISKMIKDEQIKVTGCRFVSLRGRSVKRCSASIRLRVF